MESAKKLSAEQEEELLQTLQERFEKNMDRHQGIEWSAIQNKLNANPQKMWSLFEMEETGGEPDVIISSLEIDNDIITFYDCAAESPKGRRSVCYDEKARKSRKKYPPEYSAIGMAADMGIEILNEAQYRELQQFGDFDTKTSSWILTPEPIRSQGGAIFGDWRYGAVFIYHNGADSYYGARGFRGMLEV